MGKLEAYPAETALIAGFHHRVVVGTKQAGIGVP